MKFILKEEAENPAKNRHNYKTYSMVTLETVLSELEVQTIDEVNAGTIWNWFGYTATTAADGSWTITTDLNGASW